MSRTLRQKVKGKIRRGRMAVVRVHRWSNRYSLLDNELAKEFLPELTRFHEAVIAHFSGKQKTTLDEVFAPIITDWKVKSIIYANEKALRIFGVKPAKRAQVLRGLRALDDSNEAFVGARKQSHKMVVYDIARAVGMENAGKYLKICDDFIRRLAFFRRMAMDDIITNVQKKVNKK